MNLWAAKEFPDRILKPEWYLVPSVLGYDCMELSGEVYQYAVIQNVVGEVYQYAVIQNVGKPHFLRHAIISEDRRYNLISILYTDALYLFIFTFYSQQRRFCF